MTLGAARAFTLIEVIVASILAAGVTAAVTVAVSTSLAAASRSESSASAGLRAGAAVDRIALDLLNVVREGDLYRARVAIADGGDGERARDELLVFAGSSDRARPTNDNAEGGEYEVQYRLAEGASSVDSSGGGRGGMTLWRRVDPVPDDTADGGGVVFPVVRGVTALSLEAFDGSAWLAEWDSDRDGYPHAVRVTAWSVSEDGGRRSASRRVIAIDRVPPPYAALRPEDRETDDEEGAG